MDDARTPTHPVEAFPAPPPALALFTLFPFDLRAQSGAVRALARIGAVCSGALKSNTLIDLLFQQTKRTEKSGHDFGA